MYFAAIVTHILGSTTAIESYNGKAKSSRVGQHTYNHLRPGTKQTIAQPVTKPRQAPIFRAVPTAESLEVFGSKDTVETSTDIFQHGAACNRGVICSKAMLQGQVRGKVDEEMV